MNEYYERNKDKLRAYQKEYARKNRDRIYKQSLTRKYGMTQDEYEMMYESQNGLCAICENKCVNKQHKGNLCVDHCHETKKVRGLLCHKCNTMLGLANDNPEILEKARNYLS